MKNTIRKEIKKNIKNIPPNKKEEYSFHIGQKIIEKYGHLETRHIYIAMEDEVQTQGIISRLQKENKTILIPQMQGGEMKTINYSTQIEYTGPIDIAIIPGRAFDQNNNRLGRGKGHYDKFLAQYPKTKKVGICFHQQIIAQLPIEDHDMPMHEIITHKE